MKRRKTPSYEALLQKALIRVHGGRCVYRGTRIDVRHAAVDHVIPASRLTGGPAEREAVLTRFGIDPRSGFPTDGPLNRALTDQDFNRRKWMHVDGEWEDVIRRGLQVARETVDAVTAELEYLRLEEEVAAAWQALPSGARGNAHRLHDRLLGVPEHRPSDESRTGNHLVVRRAAVTVTARLPTVEAPRGTLCITFHGLYSRAGVLTFAHDEIVGHLFAGFGGEASHEHRPLVVYAAPDGEVTVQLGSQRLPLAREEAEQLCEALDRVALAYLGEMRRLEEKVFGSIAFPPSPHGYVLGTTDLATWAALVRHARGHPVREETDAECFSVEGAAALTVLCTEPNDPVCAPRARLHAELALARRVPVAEPRVRICWNPEDLAGSGRHKPRESHFRTGVLWTGERTSAWLAHVVDSLRPPARGWRGLRRSAPVPEPWFHPAARTRAAMPVAEHDEFRTMQLAAQALRVMEGFFAQYGQRGVSAGAQRGVYSLLAWALDAIEPGSSAGYVRATLPVPHSAGGTAERLEQAMRELEPGTRVHATIVDYALRCVIQLVESAKWRVPPYQVLDAAEEHLRPLCDEYRAMEYLESLTLHAG